MKNLAKALLGFQSEGIVLPKDARNPHFKNRYTSLDTLIERVLPLLNKHGLVVIQQPTVVDGFGTGLVTRLIHAESGEEVAETMPLLLAKNDPQGQGSALTYARRYALMSTLGLAADEDIDGHVPQPAPFRVPAPAPRPAPKPRAAAGPPADEEQRTTLLALVKAIEKLGQSNVRETLASAAKNAGGELGDLDKAGGLLVDMPTAKSLIERLGKFKRNLEKEAA